MFQKSIRCGERSHLITYSSHYRFRKFLLIEQKEVPILFLWLCLLVYSSLAFFTIFILWNIRQLLLVVVVTWNDQMETWKVITIGDQMRSCLGEKIFQWKEKSFYMFLTFLNFKNTFLNFLFYLESEKYPIFWSKPQNRLKFFKDPYRSKIIWMTIWNKEFWKLLFQILIQCTRCTLKKQFRSFCGCEGFNIWLFILCSQSLKECATEKIYTVPSNLKTQKRN